MSCVMRTVFCQLVKRFILLKYWTRVSLAVGVIKKHKKQKTKLYSKNANTYSLHSAIQKHK